MSAAVEGPSAAGKSNVVLQCLFLRSCGTPTKWCRTGWKRCLRDEPIIAGAGGAAHLPGMLAALSPLPVIGVPMPLKYLGMVSLLSIVQMPAGVPVATVSIGNARNAGLLAVRILAAGDPVMTEKMLIFQDSLRDAAEAKGAKVRGG